MLKVALIVQHAIAGAFEDNLASCKQFILSAAQKKADMIVFPEMNLTGYVAGPGIKKICRPIDNSVLTLFSNLSNTCNITILVGLAEQSKSQDIHASHLIFQPDMPLKVYRKIHTAPFEKDHFTPGNDIVTFKCHGFNIGVQLCYDAHFPELSLAMALKKVDAIIIPHASPRGNSQEKYDSWLRHLRARAFDNGIYVAACNQTGDNKMGLNFPGLSLLIGPDGNVVYRSVDSKEGMHIVNLTTDALDHVRSHQMRYFLPNRRTDLFGS